MISKKEQLKIVLRSLFSLNFIKGIIESFGHYLFEHIYWRASIHKSNNCIIHPKASIRNAHNIYIGENSHINIDCIIWAGRSSMIRIGDNVLVGPGVQFHASNHDFFLAPRPMVAQKMLDKNITIGNNVWLCSNSIITAGVQLANGIVVAAGAVVTRSFDEENIIIAGVPARKISTREKSNRLNKN